MVGGFFRTKYYVQCNAFLNKFPRSISEWIYNNTKEAKNYYNYSPLNDCPPTIYETFQYLQRLIPDFFKPIVTKLCLSMDGLP